MKNNVKKQCQEREQSEESRKQNAALEEPSNHKSSSLDYHPREFVA